MRLVIKLYVKKVIGRIKYLIYFFECVVYGLDLLYFLIVF